jgi:hypothetical protein
MLLNILNGAHHRLEILLQLQDFGPWTIMEINLLQLSLMVQLSNGIQMQQVLQELEQQLLLTHQQQQYKH